MSYTLKEITYSFDALEPQMDKETVLLHHTKHQQSYVNNLNQAIEKFPELFSKSVKELLENLNEVPEEIRTTVRNNGGGVINHELFWEMLTPNGKKSPSEKMLKKIEEDFGSFENLKTLLLETANKHFASGWAFLYQDLNGKLKINSFSGHDTPLLNKENPLIAIDVWEHSYYLKYQNLRPEYTKAVFDLLNWEIIEEKLK
jgi:Fe-Mn family superoxide dismutase